MKYFVYLNSKENASVVKQSFLMSKHLHSINNSGFYSNFMSMLEKYYSSDLNPENLSNETIRHLKLIYLGSPETEYDDIYTVSIRLLI